MTTEKEFRRKRLKAIGNAVSPLQVLPIFAAMMDANTTTEVMPKTTEIDPPGEAPGQCGYVVRSLS